MEEAYRRGNLIPPSASLEAACDDPDILIFPTPVNTTVKIINEAQVGN